MAESDDTTSDEPTAIKKNYKLLTGPDDTHFCERVTEHRNHGWDLYANPTMTFNGETVIVGQALVRPVRVEPS